ncbi:GerAB/ArcD/ProY family transporter [Paenibacillus glycinis]|uniref:GerAB/ArcD/ProY family transporter n=1 Tax=Paenibacillus glycinis TaxID=2697035 RepID=A0ABW9XME9_9BACL|nr:GerAB/ArcD/ProY family transporter [Paenibacillus glycinis]NBD23780.1 GerAB/ArcD/ProY family transporter [Paenibacillus glycinis]
MNILFYIAMLTYYMINNALFNAPNVIARNYLHHGLTAIPIGLALAGINAWLLLSVYNRFPKWTMIEINRHLCGKFFGGAISASYAALMIIIGFFMFRGSLEVIIEFLMPDTPVWFLAILLITIPLFGLLHNDSTILYLVAFFTAIAFILMLIIFWLGFKEIDPVMLKGVAVHGWKPPTVQGISASLFVCGGYVGLAIWNPFFARTSLKATLLLFVSVGLVAMSCGTIIPLAVWGPWAIRNLNLIWVMTAETLSLDLFVMERGLFLIVPLLLITGYMGVLLYIYKGYRMLDLLLNKPKATRIIIGCVLAGYVVLALSVNELKVIIRYREQYMVVWAVLQNIVGILWYALAKRKERGVSAP